MAAQKSYSSKAHTWLRLILAVRIINLFTFGPILILLEFGLEKKEKNGTLVFTNLLIKNNLQYYLSKQHKATRFYSNFACSWKSSSAT